MTSPLLNPLEDSQDVDNRTCACRLNAMALRHLRADAPQKRRKVYLEFNDLPGEQALAELSNAGFDVQTCRCLADEDAPGCHCVITGTSETILDFVTAHPKLRLASVDLPEYSWLSAN